MPTTSTGVSKRTRLLIGLVAGLLALFIFAHQVYFAKSVKAVSETVVISEFRTRGPSGANDEFIELYNVTNSPINIGGWKINRSNGTGTINTQLTITTGTTIPANGHFLATNNATGGYSGSAPANQSYSTGITDDGGIGLLDASNVIVDQVGMSSGSAYKEGSFLTTQLTTNVNRSYERKPGGTNGSTQDTDNNAADFQLISPSDPQNLSSPPTPSGNQAISTTCPTPLSTTQGTPTSTSVSATDPDGTVTSAVITSAAIPGISLDNFTPASSVGGTATATLNVSAATAEGSYNIVIQYSNNDSPTPQTVSCTVVVNVTPASTPTPTPTPTPGVPASVVISQIYGGGGNSGATLKNDFIEIINHTDATIDLNGWSVQYATSNLANWQVTTLSGSLEAGQYYLIKEAAGAGGTVELPIPDASGTIAMGAAAGKVALVSNSTALTGTCPSGSGIIDFVGYGTAATCFEGTGTTPTLTNTTAALRENDGCADTDNNASDFITGAPNPRNTSFPTHNCTILSATGSVNPSTVQPGDTTTLTVAVSPALNPPSTGITVTADLSSIGGSATQTFPGGPNIFTFEATVSVSTTAGLKSLPVMVADAEGRTANATILLSVQPLLPANHIVISQLYGGGGNTGATFTNDYVELFNPTADSVTITGWSLQYASATQTSWTNKQPLGGIIGPGEYYLVGLASGVNGTPLPVTPNISGDINMSATNGKVALVSNSNTLTGACPLGSNPAIVDFIGYGTANCHEGDANAPSPSNTTSLYRKANGLTDTDQNGADFKADAPGPRRTAPIVELGPWIAGTDPGSNDSVIPHDASITVNFSEPVDVTGSWYNIDCADTHSHNDATVAATTDFKTYVITPNVNFEFGEQCTVTINKDAVHDQDLDDSDPNTDTLFEDYVWSFTVVSAGQPAPYPPDVHLTMGNPSNATVDLLQPDNYLMVKPTYALSYNRTKGTPNWVSWHLDTSWFGNLARVDTFRPDPAIPPDWYRVQATDYFSSGFDRGHMTPNADRDNENRIPINQETYLMSNMVPQAPDNNEGPWADMENDLRGMLTSGGNNEMYIVSGPLGVGGTGSNGTKTTIANGNVTVPAFTWKVVLLLPQGDDDVVRVTAATKTIAVLMPNIQGIRDDDWHNYITTVDHIEELTGYDFFSNVPDSIENAIEAGTNGDNPPGTANQSSTTEEDVADSITLDAVSPNPNATFTTTITGQPAHGSISGTGLNLTYNPAPNFNGNDSFTYTVNDGSHESNQSTVSVTVTPVQDPPTVQDDSATIVEDSGANSIDVLANDSDVDGDSLSVSSVTQGAHGTVSISVGRAAVSYTPSANFFGNDAFTYTVTDSHNNFVTATVNISVTNVNDPPVSNNDSYVSDSNLTLNVSAPGVLNNDSDIDGPALAAALVAAPAHGNLSLNPDGSFCYSPFLDFTGVDSFTYMASDGSLSSNTSTVSITVNDTVPPVLTSSVATSLFSTTNSSLINVGLTASATDNSGGLVSIQVTVFGDEDDQTPTANNVVHSPDARDIGLNTLRLRGERIEGGDGRVYLIVITGTDPSGNVSRNFQVVVVPKSNKQSNIDAVNAQAAAAVLYAQSHNGTPPPGYFVIGDGPIIGPKQ